jgi:hypothetical protein
MIDKRIIVLRSVLALSKNNHIFRPAERSKIIL